MNKKLSSISLPKRQQSTCHILNKITVHLDILHNPYLLSSNELFQMAARINKKRSFLFVSTILGKHLPVPPAVSLASGCALAARYMEVLHHTHHPFQKEILTFITSKKDNRDKLKDILQYQFPLKEEVLFIGFAETATALGQAMFQCFQHAKYVHTTREIISEVEPIITFEEEHSHATSHRCYVDASYFQNEHPIVLVDDEMTTGKTALNIIRSIQEKFPRKEYTVASLLDWRSNEHRERFTELEKELDITIHTISLLSGSIEAIGKPIASTYSEDKTVYHPIHSQIEQHIISCPTLPYTSTKHGTSYINYTGRFGISSDDQNHIHSFAREIGHHLKRKRKGQHTLCLGTGEFMYLPMRIAAEMGENISYQSTTRSPIHPYAGNAEYAIHSRFSYESPEDKAVTNYFYNIEPGDYDEVFLFIEHDLQEDAFHPLLAQLQTVIPFVHIVSFSSLVESEEKEI
ncbi:MULTISPECIES: phosphoribosyltransferase family protein [Bacillus cereus group]|uniref:phosphoribosyltransferase family protein n=1 Tax=Bacillus cereus group TaxID=86661 RepID=UPI000BF965BD|nr:MULTISPECIES: phosphoribosyltransferase family protein [Bacillus cereus group]PFA19614.1 adenine/guanine phosphoribosyltransferase [Bacillus cereus]PFO81922.1 adenine/guanine phosphoribosyltransferase [Bacillus cereus]PFR29419.1 adenine/guanine phosphoribosyltransferase [Bacillus cereus]PGZ15092.1 adenine/guanine phosphoribosyltransferase [Bacillus cereus]